MCFSNGRMTPPTIPTHADTHTQAYTALVRLGHSAVAFPKLGIQCLMCFLLTMPMRKENVPCALFVQAASNDMSNTQLLRFGLLLAITLLSFSGNIDYCCGQRSFPRIWYSLRSGPTAGPLTLCHDHRR